MFLLNDDFSQKQSICDICLGKRGEANKCSWNQPSDQVDCSFQMLFYVLWCSAPRPWIPNITISIAITYLDAWSTNALVDALESTEVTEIYEFAKFMRAVVKLNHTSSFQKRIVSKPWLSDCHGDNTPKAYSCYAWFWLITHNTKQTHDPSDSFAGCMLTLPSNMTIEHDTIHQPSLNVIPDNNHQ